MVINLNNKNINKLDIFKSLIDKLFDLTNLNTQ